MAKVVITIEDVDMGPKAAARIVMTPGLEAINRACRESQQARTPANLVALGLADAMKKMAPISLNRADDGKIYVPGTPKGMNGQRSAIDRP